MRYQKITLWLATVLFAMILTVPGTAFAQSGHEGGLGEKKYDVNLASSTQLARADGITDEIAEAIVEYREKSGFFKSPKDLLKVPGITEDIYKVINPQQGAEGDVYVVPAEGAEEEEDEEPILAPSKC
jgi:competence ComEA-like helix-hairpin-helix protein